MVPALPPRTTVIARTFLMRLAPGDVVILLHNGIEKIKRIDQIRNDEVYVLGDHPETSTDSRQFGWLPLSSVIGKVILPRPAKD